MLAYIARRLLLIVPTLFGIMVINFVIIQAAPGGPVEQVLAQLQQVGGAAAARGPSRAGRGLDPQSTKELEPQFGYDKPAHERFVLMMKSYLTFDFGKSFFR